MGMLIPSSFQDHVASFTAPRFPHAPNQRHQWIDILVLAVCAVMCGAEGWEDMEEDGQAQAAWCAQLLDLPHGMPSHDPLRRVLARLAPEELTQGFLAWPGARSDRSGGDIVSIDGQTLRHAFDRATSTAAMHLGSAWASANRLVWGQGKVDDQSHAITALPQLWQRLDLAGAPVTLDARGCQQEIAQVITEQGADSVLALKKNQEPLYDHVTLLLDEARATACANITPAYQETGEGDHGRMATRRSWITSDIEWGGAQASWADWHSVGMVESRREMGDEVESDTRYFLPALPCDSVRVAHAVRAHGGVENSLHWGLDVSCNEEACRMRTDKGAQTFSVLRHITLHLLRRARNHQRGIKARRKRAGWDRDDLLPRVI